jgi:hypothetical protein
VLDLVRGRRRDRLLVARQDGRGLPGSWSRRASRPLTRHGRVQLALDDVPRVDDHDERLPPPACLDDEVDPERGPPVVAPDVLLAPPVRRIPHDVVGDRDAGDREPGPDVVERERARVALAGPGEVADVVLAVAVHDVLGEPADRHRDPVDGAGRLGRGPVRAGPARDDGPRGGLGGHWGEDC